jgi:tetratricopeptide (TPR) repeat protein
MVAYNRRASAWAQKGNFDQAIADCSEVIRVNTNDFYAYRIRGAAYTERGSHVKALADLNEALRIDPKDSGAFANRGLVHFRQGDYRQALADCNQAVQLDPDNAIAHNNLAWILAVCPDVNVRNGPKAVQYARTACELSNWKNANCIGTLAAAYAETGNFAEAIKWQKQCIEGTSSETELNRARNCLRLYREQKPYREKKPAGGSE